MGLRDIFRRLVGQGDVNVAKASNVGERDAVTVDVREQEGEVLPAREAMSTVDLGEPSVPVDDGFPPHDPYPAEPPAEGESAGESPFMEDRPEQ